MLKFFCPSHKDSVLNLERKGVILFVSETRTRGMKHTAWLVPLLIPSHFLSFWWITQAVMITWHVLEHSTNCLSLGAHNSHSIRMLMWVENAWQDVRACQAWWDWVHLVKLHSKVTIQYLYFFFPQQKQPLRRASGLALKRDTPVKGPVLPALTADSSVCARLPQVLGIHAGR